MVASFSAAKRTAQTEAKKKKKKKKKKTDLRNNMQN